VSALPVAPAPPVAPGEVALCVLASSSGGNCSVLVHQDRGRRRAVLIDAGLSPRRTGLALARLGLRPADVSDICFTHLDTDHCHPGWRRPPRGFDATLRVHRRHMGRAERSGMLFGTRTEPFDDGFELAPFARVVTSLLEHDDLGVAAFRFEFSTPGDSRVASLGYATDLGRVTEHCVRTLAGVGTLAIESNYCPRLQIASPRPEFLKRRIMEGSGHLSNEEALEATWSIAPRDHAVFLHLSRECNRPDLVSALHEGADYARTIAHHAEPTRWVAVRAHDAGDRVVQTRPAMEPAQLRLFARPDGARA